MSNTINGCCHLPEVINSHAWAQHSTARYTACAYGRNHNMASSKTLTAFIYLLPAQQLITDFFVWKNWEFEKPSNPGPHPNTPLKKGRHSQLRLYRERCPATCSASLPRLRRSSLPHPQILQPMIDSTGWECRWTAVASPAESPACRGGSHEELCGVASTNLHHPLQRAAWRAGYVAAPTKIAPSVQQMTCRNQPRSHSRVHTNQGILTFVHLTVWRHSVDEATLGEWISV